MAEVGLLSLARVAVEVARAVLPPYRTRFSKHQFTQPQLLAVLCLMRYEDWTFREAEVRLSEHRELRRVLGLASVPDYTTLYRFLKRLGDAPIHHALGATVPACGGRPAANRPEAGAGGGGRDGPGARRGPYVFRAAEASSRAKTAAVAALAEVGGGGGSGPADSLVAARTTGPVERLRESARGRPGRCAGYAHRVGAGRRRVRQREESHLHSSRTRSAECDPRQAREENVARARSARRDAPRLSATALSPPRSGRKRLLFGEAQALGPRAGPHVAHASAPSPAARSGLQYLPAVAIAGCKRGCQQSQMTPGSPVSTRPDSPHAAR